MLQLERNLKARPLVDAQIEAGGGHIVEIPGEADWREAAEEIRGAVQVDIRFASFKDGRGFSLAALLRERAGFTGKLRAVGDLIPDQAVHLKRVGFDDVAPEKT